MRKLMDIVDNRVVVNLDTIRAMLLVELPADRCAEQRPLLLTGSQLTARRHVKGSEGQCKAHV